MIIFCFVLQIESVESKPMDDMSVDFSALVADVAEILDKSMTNLEKLKSVLYPITTPERSLLFNTNKTEKIRASKSVFDIFYELRDYWRWDSHRLLYILIKRSKSPEALEKFNQFENKINYTKKLNEMFGHFQSIHKPLPPGYTKMVAIIEKDYSDFEVKDCQELDEYLTSCFGSPALCPPSYSDSSSIKVVWYIPIEAVSGLLSVAYQAKEIFELLSISFFEIDEIVVWNKKWPYSLQVCMYVCTYVHIYYT